MHNVPAHASAVNAPAPTSAQDVPVRASPQAVPARITLLTDFGTRDGYVAAMKGVIATRAPCAIIDDASHDIPPGDIHAAAWALDAYWLRYPPRTVHVVVVDPGVGTSRAAVAVHARERFLVGPDNGVFTRALADAGHVQSVSITNPAVLAEAVSATFHGRDVFAPAAAHLAAGGALSDLGQPADDLTRLHLAQPRVENGRVLGEVIHVDRFGNLITNITAALGASCTTARIRGHEVPICRTYGDVAVGELCTLVGSRGVLEVSVRDGSAADALRCGRGESVAAS